MTTNYNTEIRELTAAEIEAVVGGRKAGESPQEYLVEPPTKTVLLFGLPFQVQA